MGFFPVSYAQFLQPYLTDPSITQIANRTQQVRPTGAPSGDPANLMGAPTTTPSNSSDLLNAMGAPQSPVQQQNAMMGMRLNQWLAKRGGPPAAASGALDDLMKAQRSAPSDRDRAIEAYFGGGR